MLLYHDLHHYISATAFTFFCGEFPLINSQDEMDTYYSASRRFVFLIPTLPFFLLQSWEGLKNFSESGHDLLGNITCL